MDTQSEQSERKPVEMTWKQIHDWMHPSGLMGVTIARRVPVDGTEPFGCPLYTYKIDAMYNGARVGQWVRVRVNYNPRECICRPDMTVDNALVHAECVDYAHNYIAGQLRQIEGDMLYDRDQRKLALEGGKVARQTGKTERDRAKHRAATPA